MNRTNDVLLWIIFTSVLLSCSQGVRFYRSFTLPSAYGNVELKKVDEEEYFLEIDLMYMPIAEKLNRKAYVIWGQTRKDTVKLGIMKVDGEMEAHSELYTSHELERILISAESSGQTQQEPDMIVMKSEELSS